MFGLHLSDSHVWLSTSPQTEIEEWAVIIHKLKLIARNNGAIGRGTGI